jgi:tRNA-modifying protein YgfZ
MTNDYQAALEGAALFELSDRRRLELTGRDAREFLNNLCTQDVKNLPVGSSVEAFLTTNKARVIASIWIWHRKLDCLLLDFAGAQAEKIEQHLNRHLISEQVELNCFPDFKLVRIVGPQAKAVVSQAGLAPTREHVLPGQESLDLFLPNADEDRDVMWHRLLDAGAVVGTPATYDLLRIEAGLPEFGIDIDENRLAMEVNRTAQAICYTKGCFLGQETIVMARDRGQVNRLLMGVKVAEGAPLAAGAKLYRANEEVGQVTSSVFSPRLGQVIALAYLRRGNWDPGTEVMIDPTTDGRTGVVCALPFAGGAVRTLP